jgi:CubicO group peptidase (beta-lactamase class C family)
MANTTHIRDTMRKYLHLLAFLWMLANTAMAQLPSKEINDIIKTAVDSKRSKSIIIGILDSNGRRFFSEGVIDDNLRRPDLNTMYEIGSITKVFTALVLADMSLKQQLSLQDPISKFLPKSVKTPNTNGKEISLLDLSIHTSTFPRFPSNVDPKNLDDPYGDYSTNRLLEYVSNYQPDIEIGSQWRYSNTAYGLLGHILTTVSKAKNYEELIKAEICKPLGMHSTVISLTPLLLKNTATGYAEDGKPVAPLNLSAIEGGGAFRSNANDMLTFAAANLGFIQTKLSAAMWLTHTKQIQKERNSTEYATMGWTLWEKDGRKIIYKDGGTPGFRTFIGIDPQHKFAVVVLSNSNNGVTDIGKHVMKPNSPISTYIYRWNLLDTLRGTIKNSGIDAAITLYRTLKTSKQPEYFFDENQLNNLGHELRRSKRIDDAIKIFELNQSEYPNSTLVYESLGEIYKRYQKDRKKALEYFEKAATLEPSNPHWNFIIDKLKEN